MCCCLRPRLETHIVASIHFSLAKASHTAKTNIKILPWSWGERRSVPFLDSNELFYNRRARIPTWVLLGTFLCPYFPVVFLPKEQGKLSSEVLTSCNTDTFTFHETCQHVLSILTLVQFEELSPCFLHVFPLWNGLKLTTKLVVTLKVQAHTILSSLQLLPVPWHGTTSRNQHHLKGHSGTAITGHTWKPEKA